MDNQIKYFESRLGHWSLVKLYTLHSRLGQKGHFIEMAFSSDDFLSCGSYDFQNCFFLQLVNNKVYQQKMEKTPSKNGQKRQLGHSSVR